MNAHALAFDEVGLARNLAVPDVSGWDLDGIAGRFVELSGGSATAGLTLCARWVGAAQRAGGLVVWVCERHSSFFPPDMAAAGVDVSALAVVRVEDGGRVWRACDTLLRSGGFALVVADFNGPLRLPFAAQTRLVGLAQRHDTALVALTREVEVQGDGGRKGSLVSLRAQTAKHRAGHDCFVCEACVVKDKRRPPGWMHEELCCGVEGVC